MDMRSVYLVLVLPAILLHMTSVAFGQDLNGCGTVKGCFKQPVDCTGNDCMAYVTWETATNGETRFSMRARTLAWIAVGLRPSGAQTSSNMYPADVYACTKNNEVKRSENVDPGSLDSTATTIPNGAVTKESATFVNNVISCVFTRQPSVAGDATFYNISGDNQYLILLAIGDHIKTDGTIVGNIHQDKWSAGSPVKLQSDFTPPPTYKSGETMPKTHASLMVIAWVGFASIGITLARFFKPMWPTSKLLGQKVWFTIHRMCMVTCVLCFLAAFVVIFVHLRGFVETQETLSVIHAILGIIATCLGIINPIMAIFRPHPGTENRPIFNWAHWGVGMSAHLIALVTVFIGIGYNASGLLDGTPNYVFFVMVVFTGFHFLIWILFEVQRCMTESQARSNDIPLKGTSDHRMTGDSSNHLAGEDSDTPPDYLTPEAPCISQVTKEGSTAKVILLCIYVVGVIISVFFLVISFAIVGI